MNFANVEAVPTVESFAPDFWNRKTTPSTPTRPAPPERLPGQTGWDYHRSQPYMDYLAAWQSTDEYKELKRLRDAKDAEMRASQPARAEAQAAGKVARENLLKIDPNANIHAISIEPEESFDSQDTTVFPDCPVLPGPLTDLAKALYPSLPLEFKQIGLIARWGLLRSGIDRLQAEQHIQPRFYVSLISLPNRGKTAAINETRTAMRTILDRAKGLEVAPELTPTMNFGRVEDMSSADSGPALVSKFFSLIETSKQAAMPGEQISGKILLDPDELSDVFEKGRSSGTRASTLFSEFLKLHSGNRSGNSTKGTGDQAVEHAHLAILGGATVDKYSTLWTGTGAGSDGLMSRFVPMTTNAPPVPAIPLATDMIAAERAFDRLARLALLPGQEIVFSPDAAAVLTAWWASVDSSNKHTTRVLEMVKQLLIVLAVTNAPEDHTGPTLTVGTDLMQQAIAFGKYVIAAREILNPADSWSVVQAMENHIVAWMKKNSPVTSPKTFNDARRGVRPDRKPGGFGVFKLAWSNCLGAGVLKVRDKSQRTDRYSL